MNVSALCDLIAQLQEVFKILRILAFVGAGFIVANWAWDLIVKGKIGDKAGLEAFKTNGIPMIIGFTLLFAIGVVLSFLMSGRIGGCPNLVTGW
jgi:hypothetical protein